REVVAASRLIDLASVDLHRRVRVLEAAHARAFEADLVTHPQRVAGSGARRVEHERREGLVGRVALTAELERVHLDQEVHPPPLPGGELEPSEVEYVGPLSH